MQFDILDFTEAELEALTEIQMQLLRNAQKKKNELDRKREQDFELFYKLIYSNGMYNSSLPSQKESELADEYFYRLDELTEQLEYAMELNSPIPDGQGSEEAGYIVNYNLSYTDRYIIVRDYYLAIEDPAERMALYEADDVARRYLGAYYSTLYNVLYVYST